MKFTHWTLALMAAGTLSACGSDSRDGSSGFVSDFSLKGAAATLTPTDFASVMSLRPLTTKTITHVMAVNPSSQNPYRVLTAIGSDGSFTLPVATGHSWVIVFIDKNQVGANMIVGAYKQSAHDLDSLAPVTAGSADLGTVSFTGSVASGTTAAADLLTSLGMTSAAADALGAADDMCLRYINPDIDGDGVIDVTQSNANFGLDFHTRFNLKTGSGTTAVMTDLENALLPNTVDIDYTGVGAYVGWPKAYYDTGADSSTSTLVTTGTNAYSGALDGTSTTGWGDYRATGKEFSSSTQIPQGQYVFSLNSGAKTFTFTNIKTKTQAQLSAADEFIMPFIKFNTVGSTTGGLVESIGYEWRIRRSGTWVAPTLEELAAIVNTEGAYISFKPRSDSTAKNIGFKVPMTSLSGTIPFTVAASTGLTGGMLEAELTSLTVAKICHLGLSYDDKLGGRYFAGVFNVAQASGGCDP